MIKIIFVTILFLSLQSTAMNITCICDLGFKKTDFSEYTEQVEVNCPDTETTLDLTCNGDEFAGTLTATCSNSKTNETKTNSGWKQWDAEPTSPWPSCSLR